MPYYHCRKCHHEFEGYIRNGIPKCDWCGTDRPRSLENETPLEKLTKELLEKGVENWMSTSKEKKSP